MDVDIYEALSKRLFIDELRLDEEIIELPQLLQDVNEFVASATHERDKAQYDLKLTTADVSREIRAESATSTKRPTEAAIETEIVLNERVQQATITYENAKYVLARWQALSESVRAKGYALKNIADLVVSGFITPNALVDRRRTEVYRKRRKLD